MKNFEHFQIFKALVGSQSYGTALPTSDQDFKGVFVQNERDILGYKYKEQYEVSKDECYFEVRRFVELLRTANPTMLELLYTPQDCIIQKDKAFDIILRHKEKFITKTCRHSFGGYAIAQIKKARGTDKKMNWEKERMVRKTILDFCYVVENGSSKVKPLKTFFEEGNHRQEFCGLTKLDHMRDTYALYYDLAEHWQVAMGNKVPDSKYAGIASENGNDVKTSNVNIDDEPIGILSFNKDAYSIHCKDYKQYETWLAERNEQRFIDVKNHDQKIDGKNMLHCVRLIETAIEIATEKRINVRRPNAAELIKIRKGEVDLATLIDRAEANIELLDKAFMESDLPETVDMNFCHELVLEVREAVKNKIISFV